MTRRATRLADAIGRGLVAGAAGTAAMTVSSTVEARLRGRAPSTAPARATTKALGIAGFDSALAEARWNDLAHWGYGTGWGIVRGLLALTPLSGPRATAAHGAAIWGSAQVTLPALDIVPPAIFWGAEEVAITRCTTRSTRWRPGRRTRRCAAAPEVSLRRAHVAEREDIDFSYTLTDRVIRLSLGELADFSGAKYDGNFSLTLEEAQRRKHEYVIEQLGIAPGQRVLDLGCGWGALLNSVRGVGAQGLGVTLSSAQVEACHRHGLDVRLHDAREVTLASFGPFDAVASLGAFEHFCSPEDYAAGRQEDVYRGLFARIAGLLPDRGRFYLQTMVFGRNMIPPEEVDRHAPRESDAWYLAMMRAAFPGSWLPFGSEQVVRCAEPHFRLVSSVSGRLDYIQTIKEWDERTEAWTPRLALLKLGLIPKWLTSPDFRFAFTSGASSNLVCFERELMDHYRLVFERA